MSRLLNATVLLLGLTLALTACGSDSDDSGPTSDDALINENLGSYSDETLIGDGTGSDAAEPETSGTGNDS